MFPGISKYSLTNGAIPPIGLNRNDTYYCWAMTLFQMIVRAFELDEIPENFASLRNIMEIYLNDQQKGEDVSSLPPGRIGRALKYEGGGNIQEDPRLFFESLIATQNFLSQVPETKTTLKKNSGYAVIDDSEMQPLIFNLANPSGKKKASLEEMKLPYFCEKNKEGNYIQKTQFKEAPRHLFFSFVTHGVKCSSVERLYSKVDRIKHRASENLIIKMAGRIFSPITRIAFLQTFSEKISHLIHKALAYIKVTYEAHYYDPKKKEDLGIEVTLPDLLQLKEGHELKHDVFSKKYEIDAIIKLAWWRPEKIDNNGHIDHESGHYIVYIKGKDKVWYECDDHKVTKLSKKIPTKSPALVHYHLMEKT